VCLCHAEDGIRDRNVTGVQTCALPIFRGWGAYYQHGATRDSFHRIDHQIFLALWQWAKRRHSKKGKRWIKDRYWHNIRGNSWTRSEERRVGKGWRGWGAGEEVREEIAK